MATKEKLSPEQITLGGKILDLVEYETMRLVPPTVYPASIPFWRKDRKIFPARTPAPRLRNVPMEAAAHPAHMIELQGLFDLHRKTDLLEKSFKHTVFPTFSGYAGFV